MSGLNNHKAEILQTWGEPRVISAVYQSHTLHSVR